MYKQRVVGVWNKLAGLPGSGENFSIKALCKNNCSDPAEVTRVTWEMNWPHMPEISVNIKNYVLLLNCFL